VFGEDSERGLSKQQGERDGDCAGEKKNCGAEGRTTGIPWGRKSRKMGGIQNLMTKMVKRISWFCH